MSITRTLRVSRIQALDATVPNWRLDPAYLYVGRKAHLQRPNVALGNPHPFAVRPCPRCSDAHLTVLHANVTEATDAYRSDKEQRALIERHLAKGTFDGVEVLVCHCKTDERNPNYPCHADVIREWITSSLVLTRLVQTRRRGALDRLREE